MADLTLLWIQLPYSSYGEYYVNILHVQSLSSACLLRMISQKKDSSRGSVRESSHILKVALSVLLRFQYLFCVSCLHCGTVSFDFVLVLFAAVNGVLCPLLAAPFLHSVHLCSGCFLGDVFLAIFPLVCSHQWQRSLSTVQCFCSLSFFLFLS